MRLSEQQSFEPSSGLVHRETGWQRPPQLIRPSGVSAPRVGLARWFKNGLSDPFEMSSGHADDSHFITYSLKLADVDFSIGRHQVTRGNVLPGLVLLQGPTAEFRRSIYRNDFDFFRIYFPQKLLAECAEAIFGRQPETEVMLFRPHFVRDEVVENLTRALLHVDEDGGILGPSFVDGVGLAIAARLVDMYMRPRKVKVRKGPLPLPYWRLKRVFEYIEAHLAEPIYLADLSELVGLSRMHFSAQFRAATGASPYSYILKRRIALAQHLLLDPRMPVSSVAKALGFRSPGHFTTAFKTIVSEGPSQWRFRMIG
ncbi:helix-turn-helix domain-containing protein [Bradyrhizobium diazoefficiens]